MNATLRTPVRFGPPIVLSALALVGTLAWGRALAQSTPGATPYALEPSSSYNVGCYGPCDCAVRSTPVTGTFRLRLQSVDPLFKTYSVEDFRGTVRTDSGLVELQGSGEYRIGGEVALMHQLRLDLRHPDAGIIRFDSDLVPGGGSFPAIAISTAAHAFACYDTVIDVFAGPFMAGVPWPEGTRLALRAAPNPFVIETAIEFRLPRSAEVDIAIVDLQGREVAALARGLRLDPGSHALWWDGRSAGGTQVRAGVYLAVLHIPGATVTHRLVRL